MTPAEIDAHEFRLASKIARHRALAYADEKRTELRARVLGVELHELPSFPWQKPATTFQDDRERFRTAPYSYEGRIKFDGRDLTIAAWSIVLGVTATALRERLRRGLPLEKVFTSEREHGGRARIMITIDGVERTLQEWGASCGLDDNILHGRLRLGWTGTDLLQPKGFKRGRG